MARHKRSLKILFVADPLDHFDPVKETTLHLMKEAQHRGHEIYATVPPSLSARGTQVHAEVRKIQILGVGKKNWFKILMTANKDLRTFDAVLLRKDPPFDLPYLHHLYLLELLSEDVYMMNHPRGILTANEKLLPLSFPDLIPETLISGLRSDLLQFIKNQRSGTIIKPLESSGGRGIFLIRTPKSENIAVILETATEGFTRPVVAQAYVPQASIGDKRIMLLGQEVLGTFLRKPAPGEHRANLHSGGRAVPSRLTRRDMKIVASLRPTLTRLGLDFVGLDIIGNSLIEINLTSPMGINEINKTQGVHCEKRVLDFIENRVVDFS